MKITLRNAERKDWTSGYGVINRALSSICDSENDLSADIHLFISPPYSFLDVDASKFNVGLTMGERGDLHSYAFPFVGMSNLMDLIITPSPWQKQVMHNCGIFCPVEIVKLGIDYNAWHSPVRPGPNKNSLIVDRGRDHQGATLSLEKHFAGVHHMNCSTPQPTNSKGVEIIKKGRHKQEEMVAAYRDADVFLKWSREGWGFPILEAMCSGCLVITNCVHLGYLEHNKNALLFRSVGELIANMKRAAKEPLTKIKQAGQETAKQLTWDKARKGVLAAIHKYAK